MKTLFAKALADNYSKGHNAAIEKAAKLAEEWWDEWWSIDIDCGYATAQHFQQKFGAQSLEEAIKNLKI